MGDRHPLILASASPRRRQLLEAWGFALEVVAPEVAEWEPPTVRDDPGGVAAENAVRKFDAVRADYPDRSVLAADTVVALPPGPSAAGYRLLAKPTGVGHARSMLQALSARTHEVHTAIAFAAAGAAREVRVESASVTFRPILPDELEGYLAGGEWEGKAGAYAIQGIAGDFVTALAGELETVIGLPRVCAELGLAGKRDGECARP